MKKIVLVAAISAIMSGTAFADTNVSASSDAGAFVATQSSAIAVGNGSAYDYQFAGAAANNSSNASADTSTGYWSNGYWYNTAGGVSATADTAADTSGTSSTLVFGINGSTGSAAATGSGIAVSGQTGEAHADAQTGASIYGGWYNDGYATVNVDAESDVSTGSFSLSANVDNGIAGSTTSTAAWNTAHADAQAEYDNGWYYDDAASVATDTNVLVLGDTQVVSSSFEIGAFSITGGTANQSGDANASAYADADGYWWN